MFVSKLIPYEYINRDTIIFSNHANPTRLIYLVKDPKTGRQKTVSLVRLIHGKRERISDCDKELSFEENRETITIPLAWTLFPSNYVKLCNTVEGNIIPRNLWLSDIFMQTKEELK